MRRIVTGLIVGATVLAACSATAVVYPTVPNTTPPAPIRPNLPNAQRALVSFDACGDLLDWTIEHALERVGPYGLDGFGYYPPILFEGELTTMAAA